MSATSVPQLFETQNAQEKEENSFPAPSPHISSGLKELDQLLQGGIPRGKITEFTGSVSSGKTSLVFSILERITHQEEWAAYIDTFDSLDPTSARRAGINLDYLLWIRCRRLTENRLSPLEKALKVADLLSQAGGFGSIVLDIDGLNRQLIPLHAWFRLQRTIKGTPTGILVVSQHKSTGSAASMLFSVERGKSRWNRRQLSASEFECRVTQQTPSSPRKIENRFAGIESSAHLLKGKTHGSITIHYRF